MAEAGRMRKEELAAKNHLCSTYGFSESHLDLLKEFYVEKGDFSFQWGDPSSTTWVLIFTTFIVVDNFYFILDNSE
jgi:hypothetical protein